MNELTLDGKTYVSSKRAAEITGYAKDYVGQLCREGRVEARLVGRNWYILKSAIEKHRFTSDVEEKASGPSNMAHNKSSTWGSPQYKIDDPVDLPVINRLTEGDLVVDEPIKEAGEEPKTIEAMRDAWSAWFAGGNDESNGEEIEIAQEASESSPSEETSIPINPIAIHHTSLEALNLRRIREYQEENDIEPEESVIIKETVRVPQRRGHYGLIRVVLMTAALIFIGIGYVGSGFSSNITTSFKPASILAGVSFYNKSN